MYYIANKTIVSFKVLAVVKLYVERINNYFRAMPQHCAACKMVGGKGVRRLWVTAGKLHRKDFDGPTPTSFLCSRYFTYNCYVIEGQQHCDKCGIPAQKRLKPDSYIWVWNSNPFIRDTPAANILLSAAILFSGSTPGKIFYFLHSV